MRATLMTIALFTLLPLAEADSGNWGSRLITFMRGGADGGGGDGVAAQYSAVAGRTFSALETSCLPGKNSNTLPSDDACIRVRQLLSDMSYTIGVMSISPRSRDTIRGTDGKPRDASNDGSMNVFLDVDRWMDLQNESNPAQTKAARIQQVTLALHEPLVLAQQEAENSNAVSNELVQFLIAKGADLDQLVGKVPALGPKKAPENSAVDEKKIIAQYSRIAQQAFLASDRICMMHPPDPMDIGTMFACFQFMGEFYAHSTVVPKRRDTVKANDRKPRDAGNDGSDTIFLDVDRWADMQNESDPERIFDARIRQVSLALHEPLVLAHLETDDRYTISNQIINLLLENGFDFATLVGTPND
jgi:hypothetical protein